MDYWVYSDLREDIVGLITNFWGIVEHKEIDNLQSPKSLWCFTYCRVILDRGTTWPSVQIDGPHGGGRVMVIRIYNIATLLLPAQQRNHKESNLIQNINRVYKP